MKKIYVNRKSEMTLIKDAFEAAGMRCFRVRTECGCKDSQNHRDGVIVLEGATLRLEIVRCRGCAK